MRAVFIWASLAFFLMSCSLNDGLYVPVGVAPELANVFSLQSDPVGSTSPGSYAETSSTQQAPENDDLFSSGFDDFDKFAAGSTVKETKSQTETDQSNQKKSSTKKTTQYGYDANGNLVQKENTVKDESEKKDEDTKTKDYLKESSYGPDGQQHVRVDQQEKDIKSKTDDSIQLSSELATKHGRNGELTTQVKDEKQEVHLGDVQKETKKQTTEQARDRSGKVHTKTISSADKNDTKYDQRKDQTTVTKDTQLGPNGPHSTISGTKLKTSSDVDTTLVHKDKIKEQQKEKDGSMHTKVTQDQSEQKKLTGDRLDRTSTAKHLVDAKGNILKETTDVNAESHLLDNKFKGNTLTKEQTKNRDGTTSTTIDQVQNAIDQKVDSRLNTNAVNSDLQGVHGDHKITSTQENYFSRNEDTSKDNKEKNTNLITNKYGEKSLTEAVTGSNSHKIEDARKHQEKLDQDIKDIKGNQILTSQDKKQESNQGNNAGSSETVTKSQQFLPTGESHVITTHGKTTFDIKNDNTSSLDSRIDNVIDPQGNRQVGSTVNEKSDGLVDTQKTKEDMVTSLHRGINGEETSETDHNKDTANILQHTIKDSDISDKVITDTQGQATHANSQNVKGSDLLNHAQTSESRQTFLNKDRAGNEKALVAHKKTDSVNLEDTRQDLASTNTGTTDATGKESWVIKNRDDTSKSKDETKNYQQENSDSSKDARGNVAVKKYQAQGGEKNVGDTRKSKTLFDKGNSTPGGGPSSRIYNSNTDWSDLQNRRKTDDTLAQNHEQDYMGNVKDSLSRGQQISDVKTNSLGNKGLYDKTVSSGYGGPSSRLFQETGNVQDQIDEVTKDKNLQKSLLSGKGGSKMLASSSNKQTSNQGDDTKAYKNYDSATTGPNGDFTRYIDKTVNQQHKADKANLDKNNAVEQTSGLFGNSRLESNDNYFGHKKVDDRIAKHDTDDETINNGGPSTRLTTSNTNKQLADENLYKYQKDANSNIENEFGNQVATSSDSGSGRTVGNDLTQEGSQTDEYNGGAGQPYSLVAKQFKDRQNQQEKQKVRDQFALNEGADRFGRFKGVSQNEDYMKFLGDDRTHDENENKDLRDPTKNLFQLTSSGVHDRDNTVNNKQHRKEHAKSMNDGPSGRRVSESQNEDDTTDIFGNKRHKANRNNDAYNANTGASEVTAYGEDVDQVQHNNLGHHLSTARDESQDRLGAHHLASSLENHDSDENTNRIVSDVTNQGDISGGHNGAHQYIDQNKHNYQDDGSRKNFDKSEFHSQDQGEHYISRRSIELLDGAVSLDIRSANPGDGLAKRDYGYESTPVDYSHGPVITEEEHTDDNDKVTTKDNKVVKEAEKTLEDDTPKVKVPIDGTSAEGCSTTCTVNGYKAGIFNETRMDNGMVHKKCQCTGMIKKKEKLRRITEEKETDERKKKHTTKSRKESRLVYTDVKDPETIALDFVSPKKPPPGVPQQVIRLRVVPNWDILNAIYRQSVAQGQDDNLATFKEMFPDIDGHSVGEKAPTVDFPREIGKLLYGVDYGETGNIDGNGAQQVRKRRHHQDRHDAY